MTAGGLCNIHVIFFFAFILCIRMCPSFVCLFLSFFLFVHVYVSFLGVGAGADYVVDLLLYLIKFVVFIGSLSPLLC